jgi:subtilase family serine protease
LAFPIPPGCFDSDCEFRITVDVNNDVAESNEANNTADGVCIG